MTVYAVRNGQSHLLPFGKQQGLQGVEDSVLVHCLNRLFYASSFIDHRYAVQRLGELGK
jgi:hypothetical protein